MAARVSKVSTLITASSAQFDSTLEKVQRKWMKFKQLFSGKSNQNLMTRKERNRLLDTHPAYLSDGDADKRAKLIAGMKPKPKKQSLLGGFMGAVNPFPMLAKTGNTAFFLMGQSIKGWAKIAKLSFNGVVAGIKNLGGMFTWLRAIVAGFVAYWVGSFLIGLMDGKLKSAEFARVIGSTAESLQELEHVQRSLGGSQEDLHAALGETQLQLARLQRGDIVAIDLAKRLGLDPEKLKLMSTTDAFKVIAEKISSFPDAGQRAALAFQFFGDSARGIIPLLTQSKDGIQGMIDNAHRMGQVIDTDILEQWKQGRLILDNFKSGLEGIFLQLASTIGPYVVAVLGVLQKWAANNVNIEGGFKTIAVWIVNIFSYMQTGVIRVMQLWNLMGVGMQLVVTGIMVAIEGIKVSWAGLSAIMQGKNPFKAAEEQAKQADIAVRGMWQGLKDEANRVKDENNRLEGMIVDPKDVEQWFDKVAAQIKKGKDQLKKENSTINEAFKMQDFLGQGGNRNPMEDVLTPMEKFDQKMRDMDFMLAKGGISWQNYGRQGVKAITELESALGLSNLKLPGNYQRNTAAAQDVINKSRLEYDVKQKVTPQQRLEALQKQGNSHLAVISESSKKTAEALQNRKVATIK